METDLKMGVCKNLCYFRRDVPFNYTRRMQPLIVSNSLGLLRNRGATWRHLSKFALNQVLQIHEQKPGFQSVGQDENFREVVLTTRKIVAELYIYKKILTWRT